MRQQCHLKKRAKIEEKKNKRKPIKPKVTDEEISNFLDSEAKRTNKKNDLKEVAHETFHLIQQLHEMEVRLSEHYEIDAFEARFPNSNKRRKHVFGLRTTIRMKISENLRSLLESGLDEDEIGKHMPFIPKNQINGLILNEP